MSMKNKVMTAAAVFALSTGAAFAESHMSEAGNAMVGGAEMLPDMTIVQNASNAENLTTLVAAVQAAGLVDTLSGEGPFTVFAPTNDAFAKLDQDQVAELLKPENQAALAEILACHVVSANANSDAIFGMIDNDGGMHQVTTVGGCVLDVKRADNGDSQDLITITDERGQVATVTQADVLQSNGVVHVIDTVMLPAE
jgi:uncharacterized surface protein with fasciclin (FAS1) repeats